MPRKSRIISSTGIYHVVIRGADRQLFFEESDDYLKYLNTLSYYKSNCNFELYAYCLMSNHVHLLIKTKDVSLENIFRRINTTYASWFNSKYKRTGFLQQGRYKSVPVEDNAYLLSALRYIHYNPFKAGLEKQIGASYPWNSYHEYLSIPKLADTKKILEIYGNVEEFRIHHSIIPTEKHLDVEPARRLPLDDEEARKIIFSLTNCKTVTDFQNLNADVRDRFLVVLNNSKISIRQLNRLTGVPKGIIEKALKEAVFS